MLKSEKIDIIVLLLDDMVTTEMASDETTTFEPEMTTIIDEFEEEANPARENLDAPILLDSSWEEREVVIEQSINTECMDMKNDLFINVMSTIISTMTEYETTTVNGLNSVLFKSEGGCLPSNVNEMFSSSCVWWFLKKELPDIIRFDTFLQNVRIFSELIFQALGFQYI